MTLGLLSLLAGIYCICRGVRMWAAERLAQIAAMDLRDYYRRAP